MYTYTQRLKDTHQMHIHIDTDSHTHTYTHTLYIQHYTDRQNPYTNTYTNIPHYTHKNMQKPMYTK